VTTRVIPLDHRAQERAWLAERHRVLTELQAGRQLRLVEEVPSPSGGWRPLGEDERRAA
jgi:hypothetical protein